MEANGAETPIAARSWGCVLVAAILVTIVQPGLAAAPPDRVPRIGLLAFWPCDVGAYGQGRGEFAPFVLGMRELGHRPTSLEIVCRSTEKKGDAFETAAAELVRASVDVIVTSSQPAGRAAHAVTSTIPIVSVLSGDPVASGLAQSLARPGGNLTGVSYYATELTAKRLELLKEVVPRLALVGVLSNPQVSYLPFEDDTRRAAADLGIALKIHQVEAPADMADAFAHMDSERVDAVFVLPDMMLASEAQQIAVLALDHRLPTMAWGSWFTELGCLAAYSADYEQMERRLAFYVDRILAGADPATLPIEQPASFHLSINLKTARSLGIEMPESILLLADTVLE